MCNLCVESFDWHYSHLADKSKMVCSNETRRHRIWTGIQKFDALHGSSMQNLQMMCWLKQCALVEVDGTRMG